MLIDPHQPLPFVGSHVFACNHSQPPFAEFWYSLNYSTILSQDGIESMS
jgi:hypothetical protein